MERLNFARAALCGLTILFGSAPTALAQDRTANWREDIALARTDFLNRDRSYSDADRARAEAALRRLEERADRLSDARIIAGLAEAAAMAGNAHSRAYLLRNRGLWRRYPIRLWKFGEEWRVVAARPEHADLVGARLVTANGAAILRAERRVRTLFAGNDNWARYMAAYSLTSPDALIGVGMLRGEGAARFVFEQDGRRQTVSLAPEPFERRERPEEAWWFLSPAHPASAEWVQALAGAPLPPSLSGAGVNYRFVRCEGNIAYLQFNRAQDMQEETISAFGGRVLAGLEAHAPNVLIVDLRFNTGGDLTLGGPFIRDLARSPLAQAPGRVFVLVGPNTFSAGITHVVQMRQDSRAELVGTTPGDALQFWSEGGNVVLPHSRISMHYADLAHTYSLVDSGLPAALVALDLNVATLEPDRPADWSWQAYKAGRDPYFEAALGGPLNCGAEDAAG